jgi:hypothetical protein
MDFPATLAQAILASRPQQAHPGRGPTVLPGPGSAGSNELGIKANLDLGPILSLLGYKSPEQKMALAEQSHKLFLAAPPEMQDFWLKNPEYQQSLQQQADLGYPGVQKHPTYGLAYTGTPEQTMPYEQRGLVAGGATKFSDAQIAAGMAGAQPQQELIKSTKQMQPPSQWSMMEATGRGPQLLQEQVETGIGHTKAQTKAEYSLSNLRDVQAKALMLEANAKALGETKDPGLIKEALKSHQDVWREQSKLYTQELNMREGALERETIMNDALSRVLGHVKGLKDLTGNARFGMEAPIYWLQNARTELSRPTVDERYFAGLRGGPVQLNPREEQRRRKYITGSALIIQSLDDSADAPTVQMAIDNAALALKGMTMTPDLEKLLNRLFVVGRLVGADPSPLSGYGINGRIMVPGAK